MSAMPAPFLIRDCALITLATGRVAHDLRELRDHLAEVPASSLRHHFVESLLRPSFDDPEFRNDFALWAHEALHEESLAERISAIDPFAHADGEALRGTLLDLVETHLDETGAPRRAPAGHEFQFLRSQLLLFSTSSSAATPEQLAQLAPRLSAGSVYFHFVEARLRPPVGSDDFSAWLAAWNRRGAEGRARLATIDPAFGSLAELGERVSAALGVYRESKA